MVTKYSFRFPNKNFLKNKQTRIHLSQSVYHPEASQSDALGTSTYTHYRGLSLPDESAQRIHSASISVEGAIKPFALDRF